MKSKVFYTRVHNSDTHDCVANKLEMLLKESQVLDAIPAHAQVAVKLHFGEEGNTGYVRPQYVGLVCDQIRNLHAHPFLIDTNTLYTGRRTNSKDHHALALEHGFTHDVVHAEVIIPDDTQKEQVHRVHLDGMYVKTATIAKIFSDADAIVGIAHFKGHLMTGFGGALKNIGMGCATRSGKLFQHSGVAPFVIEKKCTGCKSCVAVCPAQAITLRDGKAGIDPSKCIGCASCIAACKFYAIDLKWESGGSLIQEKMVEYALAVLKTKKDKAVFLNFCTKITQECDCLAKDDPRIAPDVGILAGTDPVAVDKASFDLVVQAAGKDVFRHVHPKRDGSKQLAHAAKIGLGSLEYEVINV